MGFPLAFHGVALVPPKVSCKDLGHHLHMNRWNLQAEHGITIEVARNPPIAQHPVVCPKTP